MQKTDVALIRATDQGVIYTKLSQKKDRFIKTEGGIIRKWNMISISPQTESFKIPEEHYKKFISILQSKEGKVVVNNLKNKKTNEIINKFLENEHKRLMKQFEKDNIKNPDSKIYIRLINEMGAENLRGNNLLPEKKLHISKEDIYNEFIENGLLKF